MYFQYLYQIRIDVLSLLNCRSMAYCTPMFLVVVIGYGHVIFDKTSTHSRITPVFPVLLIPTISLLNYMQFWDSWASYILLPTASWMLQLDQNTCLVVPLGTCTVGRCFHGDVLLSTSSVHPHHLRQLK